MQSKENLKKNAHGSTDVQSYTISQRAFNEHTFYRTQLICYEDKGAKNRESIPQLVELKHQ